MKARTRNMSKREASFDREGFGRSPEIISLLDMATDESSDDGSDGTRNDKYSYSERLDESNAASTFTQTERATDNARILNCSEASPEASSSTSSQGNDAAKHGSGYEKSAMYELLEDRVKECWCCRVDLEEKHEQYRYYTRHSHPLFSASSEDDEENVGVCIPVCSECAILLVAADDEAAERSSTPQNHNQLDLCAICLKEDDGDETFFLCDSCPRSCCFVCVATCQGGGQRGQQIAHDLAKSDDAWSCPLCEPPSQLKGPVNKETSRSLEDTIELLYAVEDEKKNTEAKLGRLDDDDPSFAQDLELTSAHDVAEAISHQKKLLTDHYNRLGDTSAHLQEELEKLHGVDLAKIYKDTFQDLFMGVERIHSSGQMPDWVAKANQALAVRDDKLMEQMEKSPPVSEEAVPRNLGEIYKDVEDLGTDELEGSERPQKPKARGFGSRLPRLHPADRKAALEEENKIIELEKFAVVVVREKDDKRIQTRCIRPRGNEFNNSINPRRKRKKHVTSRATANASGTTRKSIVAVDQPVEDRQPAEDHSTIPAASSSLRSQTPTVSPTRALPSCSQKGAGDHANAERSPSAKLPGSVDTTPSVSKTIVASDEGSDPTALQMVKKQAASLMPRWRARVESSARIDHKATSTIASRMEIFDNSPLMLPGTQFAVAKEVAEKLKTHQVEAVQFMFRNAFADHMQEANADLGGCILAHNMGLGKTLSSIALIHAVILHELVKCVVLVVPINTVENWKNEFDKWIGQLHPRLYPMSIADAVNVVAKEQMIKRWFNSGGVLIVAPSQFVSFQEHMEEAELLIMDEAHVQLRNSQTQISASLKRVKTKRRIALTGTPLQNNLQEYYEMIEFLRPGTLGPYALFESEFSKPIIRGLLSDCSPDQLQASHEQTAKLNKLLDPFVHRKNSSELVKDLPPMQQCVLYVRPSKLQTQLHQNHKSYQQTRGSKNFFEAFSAMKPILNHPGCLYCRPQKKKGNGDSDEETAAAPFWESVIAKYDEDKLSDLDNGFKMVLLLHILVIAQRLKDKVVVFSQNIATLDFVEKLLEHPNWLKLSSHSFSRVFESNDSFGGWKKGRDYLRIDGTTPSQQRGEHISEFDRNEKARCFLLSSVACSVGINLQAANRVVLLDTHFNPTISEQAIFRLYRYGQSKPVFVYRLVTQGSMEEKVYARTVTKSGLAKLVIDKKISGRLFSAQQLADLQDNLLWVQCDSCDKWRALGDGNVDELPDKWYCHMSDDQQNKTCEDPERSQSWYEAQMQQKPMGRLGVTQQDKTSDPFISEEEKRVLESKDPVLHHILKLKIGSKKTKMVARHEFHEVLKCEDSEEVQNDPRKPSAEGEDMKHGSTLQPLSEKTPDQNYRSNHSTKEDTVICSADGCSSSTEVDEKAESYESRRSPRNIKERAHRSKESSNGDDTVPRNNKKLKKELGNDAQEANPRRIGVVGRLLKRKQRSNDSDANASTTNEPKKIRRGKKRGENVIDLTLF